jgi:hypothetical protein
MGSGEYPLSHAFLNFLHMENITVLPLDLTRSPVPEDARILYIPMPGRDWPGYKAEAIGGFLAADGRAIFALDFITAPLPNFELLLAEYGMAIGEHILLEGDPSYMFMGVPFDIIPHVFLHEITAASIEYNLLHLAPFPAALLRPSPMRGTLTVDTLWATGVESFARVEMADTLVQIPSDIPGPFDLAVTITDRAGLPGSPPSTKIVAVSTQHIVSDSIAHVVGPANWQFVADSIRWLYGRQPGLSIPMRRPPGARPLAMTGTDRGVATGIALGGIPVAILAVGAVVWLKRRHA